MSLIFHLRIIVTIQISIPFLSHEYSFNGRIRYIYIHPLPVMYHLQVHVTSCPLSSITALDEHVTSETCTLHDDRPARYKHCCHIHLAGSHEAFKRAPPWPHTLPPIFPSTSRYDPHTANWCTRPHFNELSIKTGPCLTYPNCTSPNHFLGNSD